MNTWCALNYISSSFSDIFYSLNTACFLVFVCVHPQTSDFLSIFLFCRHRKQTPKTTKQDGGYVMKRQISFSNPAFMELFSRDSMMLSVFRIKLKYYGNSFERGRRNNIDIPFGVYFTKQVNSKKSLNEQEINGSVSK